MNKLLDVAEYMHLVRRSARSAARVIARASTASKNAALLEIAATIEKREAHILEENAADVRDASAVDGYAQNYERAGGNDANNDHGLRMEQMRDSYMLAKILAAQANGMRVFGLGDNHRKNLAAIVLAAHNDWVVCDAGTFYRQQYIMHPDRDL